MFARIGKGPKEAEMGDQDRSAELSQDQRARVNARKKVAPQSGRPMTVRAVSSGDEEDLRRMFSRLSPRTIYQRFHMPYPRVPEWAVALFANANHYDGGSLLAFAGNEIAGHAMYIRSHSGQDAEMAIVVEDAWQSKGIGKLLLYELAEEARSQGIEAFTGEILSSTLAICERKG
jgi:GNAT superfamily N-acetyltransferase